jgi:hypothetical protein
MFTCMRCTSHRSRWPAHRRSAHCRRTPGTRGSCRRSLRPAHLRSFDGLSSTGHNTKAGRGGVCPAATPTWQCIGCGGDCSSAAIADSSTAHRNGWASAHDSGPAADDGPGLRRGVHLLSVMSVIVINHNNHKLLWSGESQFFK